MNYYVTVEADIIPNDFCKNYDNIITSCITTALNNTLFPFDAEVFVLLTDNEGIHTINLEQRGVDKPTDILSFPMLEYDKQLNIQTTINETVKNPQNHAVMLGDIIISAQTAVTQAQEYGHSVARELGFLATHGILHLLGYDHIEDADRLVMEAKQTEILNSLGLTRDCS